ncbi:ABC transporter permease [Candidatus Saccharibacteria bacterium]|nr:ABC transporter permease [Candidatus Saccharibacteria bacterium]
MSKQVKHKKTWLAYKTLTVASVKMYFRNRTAVFFTLFIPVMFILIFGAFNSTKQSSFKLDIVNQSNTQLSQSFVNTLTGNKDVFKTTEDDLSSAKDRLDKGKTDLVIVVPAEFGQVDPSTFGPKTAQIKTYYNKGQPQTGQAANLVVGQIVGGLNSQITKTPVVFSVQSEGVSTYNLGYIDYLVPGIVALSIMQLGIFSIAFAFVSFKSSGALRRLFVTPTHPVTFIFGQSVARLLIGVLQVSLLIGLSVLVFKVHIVGSMFNIFVLAFLGVLVFLAFGFTVAGWAKDENQAAPIANLISFPMLFLSGTFIPRDTLPNWLQTITGFFPLTYLADAMRAVSTQGSTLWQVRGDILGLVIWGVIMFIVAIKVFKWE